MRKRQTEKGVKSKREDPSETQKEIESESKRLERGGKEKRRQIDGQRRRNWRQRDGEKGKKERTSQ